MNASEAVPQSKNKENNPEAEWGKIKKEIAEQLLKMFPETDIEDHTKTIERERNFFIRVLDTVHKATTDYAENVTVLFDVDETIATHQYSRAYPQGRTVLRPSFMPLLSLIKEKGCAIGLLTSRGKLAEQIETEHLLASLKPHLKPEYLFSTKDSYDGMYGESSSEFADTMAQKYGGEGGIIDANLLGEYPPSTMGDMAKLRHLQTIRPKLPGAVVVVDDSEYTRVLNNQSGLYGVWLRATPEAIFLSF